MLFSSPLLASVWGGGNGGEGVKGEGSIMALVLDRDCFFGCLEPQQMSIVSFITNRGQLLHPLVGEFLLRCS